MATIEAPSIVKRTVEQIDSVATGQVVERHRKALKLTIDQLADRMNISSAYLRDLQKGRRNWSEQLFQTFLDACK